MYSLRDPMIAVPLKHDEPGIRGVGDGLSAEEPHDHVERRAADAEAISAMGTLALNLAHEIRNPLTPITLSAERILRQADRAAIPVAASRILRECAGTIR